MTYSRSISDVLEYYDQHVVPVLAAAIAVDDEFPIEVLNEIRSAVTHLGRANKRPEDARSYDLDAAFRHFQRATLDSAKTGIAGLARRCDQAISLLEQDYLLPPDIFSEISGIRHRRVDLSRREAQSAPTMDLVEGYLALFNEFDAYYTSLSNKYNLGDVPRRLATRRWRKRSSIALGLVGAFLVGLSTEFVAGMLF